MPSISILTLVLVAIVSLIVADAQFVEIGLERLGGGDIGALLMTVIFTALIIERAVEVYITNAFGPKEDLAGSDIALAARSVELAEEALTAEQKRQAQPGAQPDAEEITRLRTEIAKVRDELLKAKQKAEPVLAKIRRNKGAWAGAVATLLSLAAAAVGIRILGQFLPLDNSGSIVGPLANTCAMELVAQSKESVDNLSEATRAACEAVDLQLAAFRTADTILTTFVLAGGADGIHKIIKQFISYRSNPA